MSDESKYTIALVVIFSGIFLVGLLGMAAIKATQCVASWERSGLKSEWGFYQGCLVQLPDGRWLPSERLREMDIQSKGAKQ